MTDKNWRERAACRGTTNPGIFLYPSHPGRSGNKLSEANGIAQRTCASCPVQDECLEASEVENYMSPFDTKGLILAPGIWAGMTEVERKRYFRDRRKKERQT